MYVTLKITPKEEGAIPADEWGMDFFGEQLDPADAYDITVVSFSEKHYDIEMVSSILDGTI